MTGTAPDTVISIIGPGMRVVGDCETEGTVRIEGRVEGSVRAGKAVVVGKEGIVDGDIFTQDAVISGTVQGRRNAQRNREDGRRHQGQRLHDAEDVDLWRLTAEGPRNRGRQIVRQDAPSGPGLSPRSRDSLHGLLRWNTSGTSPHSHSADDRFRAARSPSAMAEDRSGLPTVCRSRVRVVPVRLTRLPTKFPQRGHSPFPHS